MIVDSVFHRKYGMKEAAVFLINSFTSASDGMA